VVVDDLDVMCVSAEPTEANTELVVDADAALTEAIAGQFFETVRWWNLQVGQGGSCVEHDKFAEGNPLKICFLTKHWTSSDPNRSGASLSGTPQSVQHPSST
jgi:hypothetical protein